MAISRLQKEQNVEALRQDLAEAPHAILVDFSGLDVAGATDLRRKLRDDEARFRVVKNTVALRAIEDSPLDTLTDAFVGQTAIAFTDGDIVGLAKTLREFAKEYETPNFKAGIVDGEPITAEQFEQLAQMPSREELIGKAIYLMNYPVSGLVTALSGILRSAVTVLDQIREKKEEAGDTGTAAPAAEAAAAADAPAEEAAADDTPAEEAPEQAAADDTPAEEAAEEAAAEDTPPEETPEEAAAGAAEDAPAEEAASDEASEATEQDAPAEAEAQAEGGDDAPGDDEE